MEVRAVTKYVHMSPQKVRLVADWCGRASAARALDLLGFAQAAARSA